NKQIEEKIRSAIDHTITERAAARELELAKSIKSKEARAEEIAWQRQLVAHDAPADAATLKLSELK
ncbi:MAG: hypothetical protein JNG84_01655, partial [Archangium sp.]|nr:hypothetical protein [Archangium sp.]